MPSRRQERINGLIVREVSSVIRTLKDTRIGFVTITRAEISPDLRHAKVFVTVLNETGDDCPTLDIIRHSAGRIRGALGDSLGMKFTPTLEFLFDRTVSYADEMDRLIRQARASDPDHGTNEEEE